MKPEQIEEIKNYVEKHFTEKGIIEYFAKKFFYTKTNVCIEFKSKTGISLNHYIRQKRLEKMRAYLLDGMHVMEAMERVGYNSVGSYYWLIPKYKEYFGEKPIETLRRAKGAKNENS